MSHQLHNSAAWTDSRKRKESSAAAGAAAAAGTSSTPVAAAAAAAAEQQQLLRRPLGSKRRRSEHAQQQPFFVGAVGDESEDAGMTEEEDDSVGELVPASARYARAAAGETDGARAKGRHNRTGQQQHQNRGNSLSEQEQQQQFASAAANVMQLAGLQREVEEEQEEEEEEEEEADQEQFTAELNEAMPAENVENEVFAVRGQGLAGHLKSIQVQNFMNHQNFAMDFGTHVNVISGKNGSGKSAALQAIQCALGAQARKTGRADKIANLVRTGCHEAKVQVALWNTGEDPYQHRVYGDHLTVERVIKASGVSKWRLLDSAGRKVSERRKDLDDLLDHLNIDATNPMAVMTQDTSRNFLCETVAHKEMYELFMRATMLQQTQYKLQQAQGCLEQMKELLEDIVAEHSERKARMAGTREKLARLKGFAGLVSCMQLFEKAQYWAAVEARMRMAETLREQLEDVHPRRLDKVQGVLDEANKAMADLCEQEEQLTAAATQYQATSESFTAEMRRLQEQLKASRSEHRSRRRAAKQAEEALHALQEELRTLLESNKEVNDEMQCDYAEKMQQHQAQLEAAQQAIAAAQARFAEHDKAQKQALEQKQAKEEELHNAQQSLQSAQQLENNLKQQQQQLIAARGQKLAMFGKHAQLRVLVDRNTPAFERVPIGPIGAHLTLTDEKWKVATEVVLGSCLEVWIVHCRRDKEALLKLAGQARMRRPTVLEASFDRPPYNIPASQQVPNSWTTLRQFVRVEHPHYAHIIDNKLMDMSHYECVVVDQEEQRCRQATHGRAAGPNVARVVHVGGLNWHRKGEAWIAANYFEDRQPRVGASYEAHLTSLEQRLQSQKNVVAELQQRVAGLHREVQQQAQHAEQLQREGLQIMKQIRLTQRQYTQLQTQAPVMDAAGDDDDGADLAEQQRSLQQQVGEARNTHDRAVAELEQARLKQEQAQQLCDSRKAEVDERLAAMTSRADEMQALGQERARLQGVIDACNARIQKVQGDVAAARADADKVARQIQELRQQALSLHGGSEAEGWAALAAARDAMRVALAGKIRRRTDAGQLEGLSEEKIQEQAAAEYNDTVLQTEWQHFKRQADELHEHVKAAKEDAGGTRAELQHKLDKVEAEWRRHEPSVRYVRKVVHRTNKAVSDRWDNFQELFDTVCSIVNNKFKVYMHRRGHQGRVRVDRGSGELRLLVKVNAQGQGSDARKTVKDLKQLSGGERSFTSVAFFLALGEFVESPFRAVDEFDVYMDAINRRIATQTLLEFARENGDLQFILLTPQDLQAFEDAKRKLAEDGRALPEGFVKVLQMPAARTGQQQRQAAAAEQ